MYHILGMFTQVSALVCEFIFVSSVVKVLDNSLYISIPKSLKYSFYEILGLNWLWITRCKRPVHHTC